MGLTTTFDLDATSIALSIAVAIFATLKKKFWDKTNISLGGFLADALTISVIVPFFTLIHAAWFTNTSIELVISQNKVLLSLALTVCSLMMLRIVFYPDGFRSEGSTGASTD